MLSQKTLEMYPSLAEAGTIPLEAVDALNALVEANHAYRIQMANIQADIDFIAGKVAIITNMLGINPDEFGKKRNALETMKLKTKVLTHIPKVWEMFTNEDDEIESFEWSRVLRTLEKYVSALPVVEDKKLLNAGQ